MKSFRRFGPEGTGTLGAKVRLLEVINLALHLSHLIKCYCYNLKSACWPEVPPGQQSPSTQFAQQVNLEIIMSPKHFFIKEQHSGSKGKDEHPKSHCFMTGLGNMDLQIQKLKLSSLKSICFCWTSWGLADSKTAISGHMMKSSSPEPLLSINSSQFINFSEINTAPSHCLALVCSTVNNITPVLGNLTCKNLDCLLLPP